jgi:hypothetical protein
VNPGVFLPLSQHWERGPGGEGLLLGLPGLCGYEPQLR